MKAPLPGSGACLLLAEQGPQLPRAEPTPGTSTARPHRTGVPDCPPSGQAERCLGVGPPGPHGDPYTQPHSQGRSRSEGPGLMAYTSVHTPGSATTTSGDITLLTVFNHLKKCQRPRWWLSGGVSLPTQETRVQSLSGEALEPRSDSRFWEPQTLKPGRPGHRAPQGETPSQREVRTPPLKTQHGQKRINQFIFKKRATQGSQDTRSAGQPRARGPECVVTAQGMNRPGASLSRPHANANPNLPTLTTPHLLTKEQNASADSRTSVLWKNAQAAPTAV